MIKKLKGFAKDSFLYGLGDALGRLTSIILVPILSRIFVPADYGVIDLLSISYAFLLIASLFNMLTGLQRFYYLREGMERRTLVTSITFGLSLLVSFISIFIVTFSGRISILFFNTSEYAVPVALLGFCLPVETLFGSLILLLRLNRKAILFAVYNITCLILNTFITYSCVVWLGTGLAGVFIAKLTSFLVIVVFMLFRQRSEFVWKLDFRVFREVLGYSIPGHPSILIRSIMDFLPVYILAYFSSLTLVGLYGMANRIARLIKLYEISFNRAWSPFAFSNAGKPDEKQLYEKVFKVYTASLILFGMILTLFAKEILSILTPPQYHSAFILVGGICLYSALLGLRTIFSTAVYSVNKVKFASYISSIHLIVFLGSAVILTPLYDAVGLVISLDIAAIVYTACYLITIKAYFNFSIAYARLFTIFGSACGGVLIFYQFQLSIIPTIICKLCFTLMYIIFVPHVLLSGKEKIALREYFLSAMGRGRAFLNDSWRRALYCFSKKDLRESADPGAR